MRFSTMAQQSGLRVVKQISVGTRERVLVIEAGEEQFLVGVTAQSVQLISKLETPLQEEAMSSPIAAQPFASQLGQFLKKHE